MAFVAKGQKLIKCYPQARQGVAAAKKFLDCCPSALLVVNGGRSQVGNGLAVARDGYGLSLLHLAQKLSQVSLGFCGRYFSHPATPTS